MLQPSEATTVFGLLASLAAVGCLDDLVIERRADRVEWEDLFMEYNRYHAPHPVQQTVNLSIDVLAASCKDRRKAEFVLETRQVWNDDRLRFHGFSPVPVPSNVLPWTPDTYIRDAFDDATTHKSLTLSHNGDFSLKERHSIRVAVHPYNDAGCLNFSLTFSSFDSFGTSEIVYSLVSSQALDHPSDVQTLTRKSFDGVVFNDVVFSICLPDPEASTDGESRSFSYPSSQTNETNLADIPMRPAEAATKTP